MGYFRRFALLKRVISKAVLICLTVALANSVIADDGVNGRFGAKNLRFTKGVPSAADIEIYPWEPITHKAILPNTHPIPAKIGSALSITACRNEYEPASFIVRALKTVPDIQFVVSDLTGPNNAIISSDMIDLRVVKCWYQGGPTIFIKQKALVPELLLKDDTLVRVDTHKKINYLKVRVNDAERYIDISSPNAGMPPNAVVRDAVALQPFTVQGGGNKQMWVTARVPDDAPYGLYQGTIEIYSGKIHLQSITINLEVLSFELNRQNAEFGIFYRGKLSADRKNAIGSEWKSVEQYTAEIENMRRHGIGAPTLYQELKDDKAVHQALKIRQEAGLSAENLYVYGTRTDDVHIQKIRDKVYNEVKEWVKIAEQYSYNDVYIYGKDEAEGQDLAEQRRAWEDIQKMGAKIFASCSGGAVDTVGDILDRPVLAGNTNFRRSDITKWAQKGNPALSYDNPQVGNENPSVYRSNYGFKIITEGYTGAMPYAYQHAFGNIWNDFDHADFRDHVFAYPTTTSVIDTIQWEGFREAIDDIRYFNTLSSKAGPSEKEATLTWLRQEIKFKKSASYIRRSVVTKIGRLN